VALICTLMDRLKPNGAPHARLVKFVADRPGHDWRYAIDASKTMRELQWRPIESCEKGIARTLEWHLNGSSALRNAGQRG
jgi:dTDP-glucose 4,6-dehydratase